MGGSTCGTIEVGLDLLAPGLKLKLCTSGQSMKATIAAMTGLYYWSLHCRGAIANDTDIRYAVPAGGFLVEVWDG